MLKIFLIIIGVFWGLGLIISVIGIINAPKEEDLWKNNYWRD